MNELEEIRKAYGIKPMTKDEELALLEKKLVYAEKQYKIAKKQRDNAKHRLDLLRKATWQNKR